MFSFVIITIATFFIVTRALHLNPRLWPPHNIIKILMGSPIAENPQEFHEIILYLSLSIVSAFVSANILEQLLELYIWKDTFPELDKLKDVVDEGIVPSVTLSTKMVMSSYGNKALQSILQNSTTIESEEMVIKCIEQLVNQKSVNGCEVSKIVELDNLLN